MKRKTRSENRKLSKVTASSLVANSTQATGLSMAIPIGQVADIAIELWKIKARAEKVLGNEKVLTACERASDRLMRIGFEIEDLTGEPYDINMKVRVIEHELGSGMLRVLECLTPAVYFERVLVSEAEVVTTGEKS